MKKLLLILLLPILASAVERDQYGRIARSRVEVAKFKRHHPCPATGYRFGSCSGWVIDHIIPLCSGGLDSAALNMQWQTVADAKIKDKQERKQCAALRK